jgi:Flp pilus assembly protein TadG
MKSLRSVLACRLRSAVFAVARKFRNDSGSALIELALVVAVLGAPLMLGTAEAGFFVYDSIEIANAAHAGSMYGMVSTTNANNSSAIQTAAQEEAGDFGTSLTVTPTIFWACSTAENGTQYTSSASATSACTGSGNHAIEFIQVVASATATPPIHCPGLPASWSISSTSIMEVEE